MLKTLAVLLLIAQSTLAAGARPKRNASLPVATRDGKRIAFTSELEGHTRIYSMNLDGSGVRRLTNSTTTWDGGPDWSPDGTWLAFAVWHGEGKPMSIDVVRADGTGRRTVGSSEEAAWPRVSPDGKRIVFRGKDAIYIINADGTNLQRFPTGLKDAWDPEWSPDGKRMLFAATPDFKAKNAKSVIYVANVDGSNRRRVATVPGVIQLPRWSPDGKTVAYQRNDSPAEGNVILLDVATGKVKTLTKHSDRQYLDETPAWLPDGRLLFQSTRDGAYEIYRMNADGSAQERIRFAPPRASVDVDGIPVEYRRAGKGAPAVIFEAGFGGELDVWDRIQPEIAALTTTFAYTRTSSAERDEDGVRTSEEAARFLRRTLEKAGIPPPYVLVGISLGGLYMQKFAQLFPDETAAIVLVDNRPATLRAKCRAAGVEQCQFSDEPRPQWSPAIRNTFVGIPSSEKNAPTAAQLGNIPVVVLTATLPAMERGERFQAMWIEAQKEFAAALKNGRLVILEGTSHETLDNEHAPLVIREIRATLSSLD